MCHRHRPFSSSFSAFAYAMPRTTPAPASTSASRGERTTRALASTTAVPPGQGVQRHREGGGSSFYSTEPLHQHPSWSRPSTDARRRGRGLHRVSHAGREAPGAGRRLHPTPPPCGPVPRLASDVPPATRKLLGAGAGDLRWVSERLGLTLARNRQTRITWTSLSSRELLNHFFSKAL
jgi:hypothetical protein